MSARLCFHVHVHVHMDMDILSGHVNEDMSSVDIFMDLSS